MYIREKREMGIDEEMGGRRQMDRKRGRETIPVFTFFYKYYLKLVVITSS